MSTLPLFETDEPAPSRSDEKRAFLLEIHARLCREYNCPIAYFADLEPLDELISSLLSHRTKNADSARAWKQLRQRFATWEEVLEAPVDEVREAIAPSTWPEQKAPRIQAVLREIQTRTGGFNLDFLENLGVVQARAWLESITGIGPKTSAAVLCFSKLRRRALPVDSHHHRVAIRLGIIPSSLSVGPSHAVLEAMLPADWNAQQVYDNHEVLMLHGQRVCHHHGPKCEQCLLLELCPTGKTRLNMK